MANSIPKNQIVAYESLAILENNLAFLGNINTDYVDYFGKVNGGTGAKPGASILIPKPPRFVGRVGQNISIENIVMTTTPMTLNIQFGVDFAWGSLEEYTDIADAKEKILEPAMASIANTADYMALQFALAVCPNTVGTAGQPLNSQAIVNAAKVKMDKALAPKDGKRFLLVDSQAESDFVNGTSTTFNNQDLIGKQYATGRMGTALGFDWYMTENLPRVTSGTFGGTPVVSGANQTGTTLVLSGFTAGSQLTPSDSFTIAGVFGTNPQNRNSTGKLLQFNPTANATADGSGNMTVSVYPALTPTGQLQNVTNAPASGAALTLYTTSATAHNEALAFHRNAFAVVWADLDVPGGLDQGYMARSKRTKVAIRYLRDYIINSDQKVSRFDCAIGFGALYPEQACRIVNN